MSLLVPSSTRNYSILVADDEHRIVNEIAFRFRAEGFLVHEAYDFEQALNEFNEKQPDVVLTDIRMPKGSGTDLVKHIRSKGPVPSIVFCMTAYSDLTLAKAFEEGVDAMFQKPFRLDDVVSATRHFLQRRSVLTISSKVAFEIEERMHSLSRIIALGEMSSFIAHEINDHLFSISSQAQALEELLAQQSNNLTKPCSMASTISDHAHQVANMVHSIRTLAVGQLAPSTSLFDLNQIINETLNICAARCEKHQVEILVDRAATPLKIMGNPIQLQHALINIVNNACDAVCSKNAKWIHISLERAGEQAILAITDNGTGVPENLRASIFEPFFTTKNTTTNSGLGLTLAKRIIEANGGVLTLSPRTPKNNHTRFEISIPLFK